MSLQRIREKAESLGKYSEFQADFDHACQMGLYGAGYEWLETKWRTM
jgi:hypothetical protein